MKHALLTGAQSEYEFAVTGCRADPNRAVTPYQVTAVPLQPGKSGSRAFTTSSFAAINFTAMRARRRVRNS